MATRTQNRLSANLVKALAERGYYADGALAHQLKDKAEAAYARGTLFDKRRGLMADWAEFCNRVA